jgi:hypothetical protein
MLPFSSIVRYEMQRRVDAIRLDDRAGRARAEAARAAAAVRAGRLGRHIGRRLRIGRQRDVDVDLAEEEQRARVALQQQRVLAAPADAGLLREFDLEHRRRIGEHAVAVCADLALDALRERLQPVAQHL